MWSAFGAVSADVVHVYQSPDHLPLPVPAAQLTAIFERLEGRAQATLDGEGFPPEEVRMQRTVRVKHGRQVHAVEVPVKDGPLVDADLETIDRDFTRIYEDLYGKGSGSRDAGIDITGFQVRATGRTAELRLTATAQSDAAPARATREQDVYWSELGGFAATPVIEADATGLDETWQEGPVLVRLPDTVIVVPPGQRVAGDGNGSVVIDTGLRAGDRANTDDGGMNP